MVIKAEFKYKVIFQGADVADLFTIEYFPCFKKMHFPAILRVKKNETFCPSCGGAWLLS